MATPFKVLTYEDWLSLAETEGVEEVVQGEIRKMPPNKVIHADTVENVADLLKARLDRRTDSSPRQRFRAGDTP
jgi:Uma2 family endonuclease